MKNKQYRVYSILYWIVKVVMFFFYRIKTTGEENIPEGGAIFCGQHSAMFDPLYFCISVKRKNHFHMMAKKELERVFVVGKVIAGAGSFFVDRKKNDIGAIKTALKLLKSGEKVVIFPEGTRASEDNEVEAKTGAVRIAEKAGVPVVPVSIPRKKPIWHTMHIVIGEPYYINTEKQKLLPDDYRKIADDLMNRIYALEPAEKV